MIENHNGVIVVTGKDIGRVHLLALTAALHLETKGLKRRGRSAQSIVKKEFGIKGRTAQQVYENFCKYLKQQGTPPEGA